jgi:hypothetical protein
MIKHIVWKLPPEDMLTSDLQEKILLHVCTTKNADYKTISKETDRDRITILQSLQGLFRRHYVEKKKIVPQYEKSKLMFTPTPKGIIYALAFLNLDFKQMPQSHREQSQINKLLQRIELFPDPYHLQFAKRYAIYVLEGSDVDPFNVSGGLIGIPRQHKEEYRLIKQFLVEYVVSNTEYTTKGDIAKRLEPLKQDYSRDEQKRIQAFLSNVSGNLEFISKQFQMQTDSAKRP